VADDAARGRDHALGPELEPDVVSAFNRVQAAPAAKPRFGFSLPILRPSSRPMFAGVAAAAIVLALVVTAFATSCRCSSQRRLSRSP